MIYCSSFNEWLYSEDLLTSDSVQLRIHKHVYVLIISVRADRKSQQRTGCKICREISWSLSWSKMHKLSLWARLKIGIRLDYFCLKNIFSKSTFFKKVCEFVLFPESIRLHQKSRRCGSNKVSEIECRGPQSYRNTGCSISSGTILQLTLL
jgi:hypothetical protein